MKKYKNSDIFKTIKLAGLPGLLLLGYYVVQIVFARQKSDITAVDGSAMIFAAYAMGSGLYCLWNFQKGVFSKKVLKLFLKKTPLAWFIAYTILCIVSAIWSPALALSAYRGLECLGLLLLNAAVIKNLLRYNDAEIMMLWSVCYAFFTVVLSFLTYYSKSGMETALYTVQFPSTIFFYLAFFFAPTKLLKWPVMLLALACKSVTGYLGMAIGMCSLMFGTKKYRLLGGGIIVALAVAVSTIGVDGVLNNTIFASKGGEAMESGTFQFDSKQSSGRSDIWGASIEAVAEADRQLYGFGFVAGETYFVQQVIGGQVIGMHNGFLSAYVGTGLFGLIMFSIFMIGYVIMPFNRHIPKRYKSVLIASMFVVLLHTCGNPGLGFRAYGTWMYAMYIVMLTCGIHLMYNHSKSLYS